MKRNLMSDLQQRSRSTFLKCHAPGAIARSPVANGQSPQLGPPTAASPALGGPQRYRRLAPGHSLVPPSTGTAPTREAQAPWPPNPPSGHLKRPGRPPAAYSRPHTPVAYALPFDTSWLLKPTTGVHSFGGGSTSFETRSQEGALLRMRS